MSEELSVGSEPGPPEGMIGWGGSMTALVGSYDLCGSIGSVTGVSVSLLPTCPSEGHGCPSGCLSNLGAMAGVFWDKFYSTFYKLSSYRDVTTPPVGWEDTMPEGPECPPNT